MKSKINPKKSIPASGVKSKHASGNEDQFPRIAALAYYKAEARGYEPGHEIQDWLEAEAEMGKVQ